MRLLVNCRLFLLIMTFGLVRLSILIEMLVFGYLKNSRFRFGLRLCQLADHSLNVTFPSHCLCSPFFKMELPSTKFRKQVNQHHHYINFNIFFVAMKTCLMHLILMKFSMIPLEDQDNKLRNCLAIHLNFVIRLTKELHPKSHAQHLIVSQNLKIFFQGIIKQ